ncbi:MAG TPA: efflux RND transporter permease subunit [Polyangiaceae bacterium]|nr:efflux RND transporter permease subunit [Polyangiaceae bacterium]
MTLAAVSIRRPVLAIVFSILIVVFGVVGFILLGVREYPAVDPPVVTISTNYAGANPEVIAAQITEPLEQNISGVPGIRSLGSTSRDGQSQIRVEFDLSVDMDAAANDVRDRVSVARQQLPADADPPVVAKADANAAPILFLTVQSDTKSIYDVAHVADTIVKERIQTIPGVAVVGLFGDKRYAMRINLDAGEMAARDVTAAEVQAAIQRENVDLPAGRLEGASTEMGLRSLTRLSTAAEFNAVTIKTERDTIIRLSDVGRAELAAENMRTGVRRGGVPMIGIAVIPQTNANAIAIADAFYQRLEEIRRVLPAEYKAEIGYDFTTYIRRSVTEVQETLALAFLLVAGIIFAFLRDWRATIIPVVAIPISIVSAFFLMYLLGYSINILTLVGLVLAIGLVCDDAIVVLENIYVKIERGRRPLEAALEGSGEIFFAVVSTTIALAAVFLPIVFLRGLTGRLFREFGAVVAGAVLVSAFVALTLSPMMCRHVLRVRHDAGSFHQRSEPFFRGLNAAYGRSLVAYLGARWLTWPLLAGIALYTFYGYSGLKRELAPLEDRSNIRISVRAPETASFEYTERALDEVGAWVQEHVPEVTRSYSIAALFGGPVNAGLQNVFLTDPSQRERSQAEIFQQIASGLGDITSLRVFPAQPPTIGDRVGGQPLQYVLQAPSSEELMRVLPGFLEAAQKRSELRFVDADLKVNREEAAVSVDRERAAQLGVSALDVARTLQLSFGDQRFGYFIMGGRQYQIIGQLDRPFRNQPADLRRLMVRSRTGQAVSLDNLVTWQERTVPSALYRFDRYYSATVSAGLSDGNTLGDGIRALDEVARATLPDTFNTTLAGQAREFRDSSSSLLFAFGLALLIVYLVLAAQFESFIDPLIVLLSVPLALSGAVLSLDLTQSSLNIFSQIGLVMLVGLVTKNGILIVEFANQKRAAGLDALSAAREAALERFRPILMTSLATILGVLPIALSLGAASASRQSLGIAVVGGLLGSTLLSLYLVPALYSFLSPRQRARSDAMDRDPQPYESANAE